MTDPAPAVEAAEPSRGLDFGPFYVETPDEVRRLEPYPGWIAEPWNAATGVLFVLIVIVWVWRLRGAASSARAGWKDEGFFHAPE